MPSIPIDPILYPEYGNINSESTLFYVAKSYVKNENAP